MTHDLTQQTEPARKSFLDVLRNNLRIANKVTFVHRLIYIGEHTFRDDPGSNIGDCMERIILEVNNGYHDEPLSGLLVSYPKYFCHVIEGSEDSLFKHLKLLTENEEYRQNLGKMKLLVCYHHINQRFIPGWMAITGKPATLVEKIDVNSDLYRTSRYVYQCVQKLYKLAFLQRPKIKEAESFVAEQTVTSRSSTSTTATFSSSRTISGIEQVKTNVSLLMEKNPIYLPEYGLLDFLLSTPYTQDLQTYINAYGTIPPLDSYKDKVWPVPSEFVPMNIFDKPQDPVTDLPTTKHEEAADILFEVE